MKLFIPGPTQVHPDLLAEMSRPAIGHRTEECADLWREARQGLAWLMQTKEEIIMLTAPASAMMEAAVRNLVKTRSLHLVNGAFSKRWFDIGAANGTEAQKLEVPMGEAVTAPMLEKLLKSEADAGRSFDIVTVVHNETSTGTVTPIAELAEVLKSSPQTLLCVDTVSSMAGSPVPVDEWGIDVCLYGLQKCLALPAGMAMASVSARALERAGEVPARGWFLDFLKLSAKNVKEQSPTTPSTAHLYALVAQLRRIREEGLDQRWQRHLDMAQRVRDWATAKGWTMFPAEGFRSPTVSCIARGDGPDFVPALNQLKADGILVSNGYGDLKGKTFRIGHMGDHQMTDIDDLLERFDQALLATAN
jgi:predicted phosphoserine aminotransferase